jgi:hypothetical protein
MISYADNTPELSKSKLWNRVSECFFDGQENNT